MPRYGIPSVHHQERANEEEQGGTKHRADDATSGSYGGISDGILIKHGVSSFSFVGYIIARVLLEVKI